VIGKKLRLLSHPVDVPQAQMVDTFRAILGRAGDEHDVNPLIPADVHLLLATQACKGAIKAGDFLNDQQVRSLCHDILAQPLSAHCPHGRPSWVKMQLHQIDHLFHRP
jgi:DNA mismatch repair protein MutL